MQVDLFEDWCGHQDLLGTSQRLQKQQTAQGEVRFAQNPDVESRFLKNCQQLTNSVYHTC